MDAKALCMLDKPSTNWAASLDPENIFNNWEDIRLMAADKILQNVHITHDSHFATSHKYWQMLKWQAHLVLLQGTICQISKFES